MKKLFVILSTTLLLASCREDKIPLPTGLFVDEVAINMVAEGETYNNRVYTTSPFLDVVVPEDAKQWLSAEMKNNYLVITAVRNASIGGRNATISLNAKNRSTTVKVDQGGLPTKKIIIDLATANSAQTSAGNESILASFDGNTETFWHSKYGDLQNVFYAVYTLAPGSASIDLVYLLPRQYPDPSRIPNGRFSLFGIWVKGDGTDTPSSDPADIDDSGKFSIDDPTSGWGGLIGSTDDEGYKLVYKGNAELSHKAIDAVIVPVNNPILVKVKFPGTTANTRGGFLSLAEIAFFGKVG